MAESDPERNLAFRNLTRARMVRLATGQQMVTFLKNKGVNVTKLTKAQLRDGNNGADLSLLTAAQREAVLKNTPLWFYILREAEFNGGKLKGVGARIVAETFHRAMEGSTHSIVRDTAFKPSLGPEQQDLPDGRPAVLRVRGQEEPAGAAGVAAPVHKSRRRNTRPGVLTPTRAEDAAGAAGVAAPVYARPGAAKLAPGSDPSLTRPTRLLAEGDEGDADQCGPLRGGAHRELNPASAVLGDLHERDAEDSLGAAVDLGLREGGLDRSGSWPRCPRPWPWRRRGWRCR